MIGKDHYYEKTVDLAMNLGELYRISNHQIGLDQIVREFRLISDQEAEQHIYQTKINQKITHKNLAKIYTFDSKDCFEEYFLEEKKDEFVSDLLQRAKRLEEV